MKPLAIGLAIITLGAYLVVMIDHDKRTKAKDTKAASSTPEPEPEPTPEPQPEPTPDPTPDA